MLLELRITDLGIIAEVLCDQRLDFGSHHGDDART